MPEAWTGNLIGMMHNHSITYDDLAAEMGVTKSYISALLNGRRNPPNAQSRMETAVCAVIQKKNAKSKENAPGR